MSQSARVAVIGSGSWGTAVAWLLDQKGLPVALWARDTALVEHFNSQHHNLRYLPELVFSTNVTASDNLADIVADAASLLLVTPSAALPEMAKRLSPIVAANTPLVILSKGLNPDNGKLLDQTLAEIVSRPDRIAVLSGPNHAEEVSRGIPSATVVASASLNCAEYFQELLATPSFRVYVSADTVGVPLCGAAKNVVAIACGLAAGMGYGDNTQAMLMTRGLAEIARLVEAAGGDQITCMGLAGMGDLIATCTSVHSRNRGFGMELAGGGSLESYQKRTQMVVEGAIAARTVTDLAASYGVEMPICQQVRSVVWENQPLEAAFSALIDRDYKPEFY
jgi:glycerol-3-phosphate dehydrogenase (NAD(P)+)